MNRARRALLKQRLVISTEGAYFAPERRYLPAMGMSICKALFRMDLWTGRSTAILKRRCLRWIYEHGDPSVLRHPADHSGWQGVVLLDGAAYPVHKFACFWFTPPAQLIVAAQIVRWVQFMNRARRALLKQRLVISTEGAYFAPERRYLLAMGMSICKAMFKMDVRTGRSTAILNRRCLRWIYE